MSKYLHNLSPISWLRKLSHDTNSASKIWSSLVRTLPIILNWISWRPGAGSLIIVGRDRILGLGENSVLLNETINHLNQSQILVLEDAVRAEFPTMPTERWKSSSDLGLTGLLSDDWNDYRRNLNGAGVALQANEQDTLVWLGADNTGVLTVKSVYEALVSLNGIPECSRWEKNLWKWPIPLKITLFFWLALHNKVLTWEQLQRRGWVGPSVCCLGN